MTVSYDVMGGMIAGAITGMVCSSFGLSSAIVLYSAIGAVGVAVVVMWRYSPLPNSSGGIATTDPLRGQYWGIHPGNRWTPPDHVAAHETEARAVYYYEDECLAIDIDNGAKAWGESADAASQELKSDLSG